MTNHGINNAMIFSACIIMVRDIVILQNIFHIFLIIFVEDTFISKYFFVKDNAMLVIVDTSNEMVCKK